MAPMRPSIGLAATAVVATVGLSVVASRYSLLQFRRTSSIPFIRVAWGSRTVWPPKQSKNGATAGGLSLPADRYPAVQRGDVVDTLHGVEVADPYRWLEEPNSEATKQFIDSQNQITDSVLAQCPGRAEVKALISSIMDHPRKGLPWRRGNRWYYYNNSGLQNQDVLFTCDSPEEPGRVFFDPNTLSDDGTVALSTIQFTPDGTVAAYMLSDSGSDWRRIRAMSVAPDGSTTDLPDLIQHVRYSGLSWTHDGEGFFYSGYDRPDEEDAASLGTGTASAVNQKLFYHRLGSNQADDVCLFATPDHPTWMCSGGVSDDGRWLWLSIGDGCEPTNKAYVCDLAALPRGADGALDLRPYVYANGAAVTLPLVRLADDFSASWSLVAAEGTRLTVQTNCGAPRQRLVALDMATARDGALTSLAFTEVLAEHPRDLLQDATPLKGDLMVVQWMRDVADVAEVRRLSDGALLAAVDLPSIGTMSGAVTEPRRASTQFWFTLTTFLEPRAAYCVDAAPLLVGAPLPPAALVHRTQLKVPHDPDAFVTRQVFVRSRDGTRVPMFVVHHKATRLDGANPTLLYGYGGFNISLQPSFSASRLAWLKAYGGVFALANLRGGGEYGRAWRDAGSRLRKQNVFDDMHACAERLVADGFCSPATLTIQGGSNGGLLVAACANQRPNLYGCVLAQVGVLDMLRFHKFTVGHAWCTDYGSPDEAEYFPYLLRYSPLHNVALPTAGGQYPAMLLLTASHDDRVSPLHSFKHLAQLQHTLIELGDGRQTNPLLARIETKAGHGAGKPTHKVIEETADMFAFAAAATGATLRV